MNANQLALLLALYRGFALAEVTEEQRANYGTDVEYLTRRGFIASQETPVGGAWLTTDRGDALVKLVLGLASTTL